MTDTRLLLLSPDDNVFVLRGAIDAGEVVALEAGQAIVPTRLGLGHKIARRAITAGERIVKYGAPIGSATEAIPAGAHVHVHNVKSDYTPTYALQATSEEVPR
jgi:hypothetical protein